MIELWMNQIYHLSIGQATVLLALSVALIGLIFYQNGREK